MQNLPVSPHFSQGKVAACVLSIMVTVMQPLRHTAADHKEFTDSSKSLACNAPEEVMTFTGKKKKKRQ